MTRETRLYDLAKRGAYDLHLHNYNADRGSHRSPEGGWAEFAICEHPDCRLVREVSDWRATCTAQIRALPQLTPPGRVGELLGPYVQLEDVLTVVEHS